MKHYNMYNPNRTKGEVNNLPSATMPGQSIPVSEMIKRYRSGMEIPINRNLIFEDENFEDPLPRITDLTDYDNINTFVGTTKEKIKKHLEDVKNQSTVIKDEPSN